MLGAARNNNNANIIVYDSGGDFGCGRTEQGLSRSLGHSVCLRCHR